MRERTFRGGFSACPTMYKYEHGVSIYVFNVNPLSFNSCTIIAERCADILTDQTLNNDGALQEYLHEVELWGEKEDNLLTVLWLRD